MVVQSNLQALNSNRMLNLTITSFSKSTEKLSSGYKINRSADDAAGLAISEKMRRQIKGLTQASSNAQDGISFCQIADGALNEVHDMLKRCQQLATQSANGTNTDTDREYLQSEVDALTKEIDRVHETSVFNELRVFTDGGYIVGEDGNIPSSVSSIKNNDGDQDPITVIWSYVGADGTVASVSTSEATGTINPASKANSELASFAVKAAASAVGKLKSAYSGMFDATSNTINIGLDLNNKDGKGRTLAFVEVGMAGNSTSTVMTYRMLIDTSDYPIESFNSYSADKKADLAATIAHEMTHAVMFDTLTNGMFGDFPSWFIEGMAQTSSGDGGWVWPGDMGHGIKADSSDQDIKNYMSKLATMPYGAGYLGTMYLGYKAAGGTLDGLSGMNATSLSSKIKEGLNNLLSDMTGVGDGNKKSLDQAIKDNTSYDGRNAFESDFKNGGSEAIAFVKKLLSVKGTDGAGSLLASSLSTTETSAFSSFGSGTGNYIIKTDNPFYSNAFGTGFTMPDNRGKEGVGDDRSEFYLQVGAEAGQGITVKQFNASAAALFGNGIGSAVPDVSTVSGAEDAINLIKIADRKVSSIRSYYGATQNRLEHTIKNLDNIVENTTSAESQIRDTNMAMEMVKYSNYMILKQSGISMLAQSNQNNTMVLSLLQ